MSKTLAAQVIDAFRAALADVSPRLLIRHKLSIVDNQLCVAGKKYASIDGKHLRLVAIGKAAADMAAGAEEAFGKYLIDGIAVVPQGTRLPQSNKITFAEGAPHNLPDETAIQATNMIRDYVKKHAQEDQIIVGLVSGGSSALLTAPIDGVTLNDKLDVIRALQSVGADIVELNIVRGALSKVKNGKLARAAAPATFVSLIISDIVGGQINRVGSGPTVPQPSSASEAIDVLKKCNLWTNINKSIRHALERQLDVGDSSGDDSNLPNVHNVLVADNRTLLDAVQQRLDALSIKSVVVSAELTGDAHQVGEQLASPLRGWLQEGKIESPSFASSSTAAAEATALLQGKVTFAWIYGGETTVRFPTEAIAGAKGGRNQEMALAVLNVLRHSSFPCHTPKSRSFIFASLGSDGQDGPTDAAGAICTDEDVDATSQLLVDAESHLNNKTS